MRAWISKRGSRYTSTMKAVALCVALTALVAVVPAHESDAGGAPQARMGSGVTTWEEIQTRIKPTKTGQRRDVFDAPTPTLDRFHCHITTLNPGDNTGPLHRHPQEEVVIVKEGTLEINIDGKKQIAGAGSMIFYAANENENMTNVGKTPATYYVLQWYTALTPRE
jgi:XRE family transcriptional regulator, regulator of sulfur utilization